MHQKHMLVIRLGLAVAGVARKHSLTRSKLEEHLTVLLPAVDLNTIGEATRMAIDSPGEQKGS